MSGKIMKKLIIATGNKKKAEEIKDIMSLSDYEVVSMADFENKPQIIEDGETFEANAVKKAVEISLFYDAMVIADDSGLEVEALGGEPGVYSARYCGRHGDDRANNDKLLHMMKGVAKEQRAARFVCVAAVAQKGQLLNTFRGELSGAITEALSGENGFGYDPVFFLPEFNRTVAQLTAPEKNRISHRYKAFVAVAEFLC